MPSRANCNGRRSKKEPVDVECMVHGLGGGFGFASDKATLECIKERRSNDIVVGIYMILFVRVVLSVSSWMSEVAAMMIRTSVRRRAEQVNAAPGRSVKVQWDIPDRGEMGL